MPRCSSLSRPLAVPLAAATLLSATLLSACGSTGSGEGSGDSGDGVHVLAAFYPLQYVADRVGGDHIRVTNLTKPGTEPHDLELTPRLRAELGEADLLVYEAGFQPAVDEAAADLGDAAFDVTRSARVDLEATAEDHTEEEAAEAADAEHALDPHFWLDPTRLAAVAEALATRLAEVDAAHAAAYRENAAAVTEDLTALDEQFRTGLANCTSKDLVTSHAAFGYLARAYGFEQRSITGLSPEAEPNASAIAAISDFVRQEGVRTVYAETLVSREVADTVGRETGAEVAVLDPLEGLTDASAGSDYREVMLANLATLQKGQGCR